MSSNRFLRRSAALALATGLSITAAACSSSGDSGGGGGKATDGKTTITVNCEPPKSAKVDRKSFEDDIAAFEKLNLRMCRIDVAEIVA